MIIVFSWISILLLFYIGYLYATKQTEKYIFFALCSWFFILLFVVVDYQTSMLRNDIVDFYSITERVEVCDFTSIHSDCMIEETKNYDTSNDYVGQYYALRDLQFSITGLVSSISLLAFGLFFILILIHYLKEWRLLK
jgi:hypothetical protein